jgi:hypothetical protein
VGPGQRHYVHIVQQGISTNRRVKSKDQRGVHRYVLP